MGGSITETPAEVSQSLALARVRLEDLAQALETRIGGGQRREEVANASDAAEHPDAQEAFHVAEAVWADAGMAGEGVLETPGVVISEERLKRIIDSATASQRKETSENTKAKTGGEASLREAKAYTAADVHAWMAENRARKNRAVRSEENAVVDVADCG